MRIEFDWGIDDTTITWKIGGTAIGSITLGQPMVSLAAVLPGMRKFYNGELSPMWWGDIRFYDNGPAPSSTGAATTVSAPQFAGAPRQGGAYASSRQSPTTTAGGAGVVIITCSENILLTAPWARNPDPAPAGTFILSATSVCPPDTSFIESKNECRWAALSLALDGADETVQVNPGTGAKPAEGNTYGCAHSQAAATAGLGGAVRFNSVGAKTGNGTDAGANLFVNSICHSGNRECPRTSRLLPAGPARSSLMCYCVSFWGTADQSCGAGCCCLQLRRTGLESTTRTTARLAGAYTGGPWIQRFVLGHKKIGVCDSFFLWPKLDRCYRNSTGRVRSRCCLQRVCVCRFCRCCGQACWVPSLV